DKPALLVADTNTFAAAGRAVVAAFRSAGQACREPFVFTDPNLYAEQKYVVALEAALQGHNAIPVAVGSGTINDLTKLAAHRVGRPYLAVATAASMDGYTAFGASITYQGSKQTFSCPAPMVVVADLDVVCAAPAGMNASGYADLLAKTTAGADWLLADALGVEAIDSKAWSIVQGGLRSAVANPAGVRSGDHEATRQLTEGLMLSGFAMQWAKSSRPASGAEHQFSHLWDMQHHVHNGRIPLHGFKVGIGTLAVAGLYEYLLNAKLDDLDMGRCCAQWPDDAARETTVRALFSQPDLTAVALKESQAKQIDAAGLRRQLETLQRAWPSLKESLRQQLIPLVELKSMLRAAGAPTEPEEIGFSRELLRESVRQAYYLRRRFTVLDLAARCGLMEPALDHLFSLAGPWPTARS
ncbi:MAG: sn-glycerol-1-phosphate dehydrogenase, partial [Verrucomicrobia bacterium]|nr:sn-glycerol-1-phosphate dehydrogenase [Verrucomicrobiota bacterium]